MAKTKVTKPKQAAAAAKPPVGKSKIAPDATVIWAGKENPFREGSGAHARTEIVRKASGQQVSAVQAHTALRKTTITTLARMKLIKFQ
jgi:hypothetical protein